MIPENWMLLIAGLGLGVVAYYGFELATLLRRKREAARLAIIDSATALLEAWSRQGVRAAEELSAKASAKVSSTSKLELAMQYVKDQSLLAGLPEPPPEHLVPLVEGSLAAERRFLDTPTELVIDTTGQEWLPYETADPQFYDPDGGDAPLPPGINDMEVSDGGEDGEEPVLGRSEPRPLDGP